MLQVAVLLLLVLASLALSAWSWRKLRSLEQRSGGAFRTGPLALYGLLPVVITAGILAWRHSLSGWVAVEFLIAYSAVAYPLLIWMAYLLMRIARRGPH